MSFTHTAYLDASGHTLAATLRNVLANGQVARIELAPQCVLSAEDCEFDTTYTEMISGSRGGWSLANGTNLTSLDANSNYKSALCFKNNATSTNWSASTTSGPFLYKVLSGDFDVCMRPVWGNYTSGQGVQILAQSTSTSNDYVAIRCQASGGAARIEFLSTDNGTNSASDSDQTRTPWVGFAGLVIRLKRSTNDFSGYVSIDYGVTWTQVGVTKTRADFSVNQNLGPSIFSANTSNQFATAIEWIRNTQMFDTTSPVSSRVYDSGYTGVTWKPSTFLAVVNPYFDDGGASASRGFTAPKYRIAASNSSPPALAGAILTEAGVQALADIAGRYLNFEVTYISTNSYDNSIFCGALMDRTFPVGSGGAVFKGVYSGSMM